MIRFAILIYFQSFFRQLSCQPPWMLAVLQHSNLISRRERCILSPDLMWLGVIQTSGCLTPPFWFNSVMQSPWMSLPNRFHRYLKNVSGSVVKGELFGLANTNTQLPGKLPFSCHHYNWEKLLILILSQRHHWGDHHGEDYSQWFSGREKPRWSWLSKWISNSLFHI